MAGVWYVTYVQRHGVDGMAKQATYELQTSRRVLFSAATLEEGWQIRRSR